MSTIPALSHIAAEDRAARPTQRSLARIRYGRFLTKSHFQVDVWLLCVAFLAVVLLPPLRTHDLRFSQVLALRFSLINLGVTALCIWLWRMSIRLVDFKIPERLSPLAGVLLELTLRVTTCTVIAGFAIWLRHPKQLSALEMVAFWVTSLSLCVAARAVWMLVAVYVAPVLRGDRRVVIVGTGWRARRCAEEIRAHPRWHYELLGYVDNDPQFSGDEFLGRTQDLETILMQRVVDEVIIALPVKSKYDDIQQAIAACERLGVQSEYSTDLFATKIAKRRSQGSQPAASVVLHMVHDDRRQHFKRAVDFVGALFGLILLSPLMVAVAIAVKLTSKGPVIFRQQRFGLNKRLFHMYKFRSMVVDAEQQQAKLEHLNEAGGPVFKMRRDPRVTSIGNFIRKTSIDELPQLFNVLRGDMSLVGPRPLPMRDVSRFSEAWLMRRFSVRPGLTGLWQVSGRSDTTFANWIELDLKYIDGWSLLLDCKILVNTFSAVVKSKGAV